MDKRLHDFIDAHAGEIIASPTADGNGMIYIMLNKRPIREELNAIGVGFNTFTCADDAISWHDERVLQFSVLEVVRDKEDAETLLGTCPAKDDLHCDRNSLCTRAKGCHPPIQINGVGVEYRLDLSVQDEDAYVHDIRPEDDGDLQPV